MERGFYLRRGAVLLLLAEMVEADDLLALCRLVFLGHLLYLGFHHRNRLLGGWLDLLAARGA